MRQRRKYQAKLDAALTRALAVTLKEIIKKRDERTKGVEEDEHEPSVSKCDS
jgi:hypothetical protein